MKYFAMFFIAFVLVLVACEPCCAEENAQAASAETLQETLMGEDFEQTVTQNLTMQTVLIEFQLLVTCILIGLFVVYMFLERFK